ncbi:MAG: hypothetical protein DRP56_09425 [Planctomycetota bacterium]|nr:MAG: hypothetical protein DRP56_09425 [Planctomycetota bacterium]
MKSTLVVYFQQKKGFNMNETEFLKLPVEPIPKILVAGHYYHKDKAFLRKYYTDDSFCLHLYDYPGTIKIGNLTFRFKAGGMTIIAPFTEYSYDLPHAGHHYCIHFHIENKNCKVNELKLPFFSQMGNNIEYEIIKTKLKEIIEFDFMKESNKIAAAAAGISLLQMLCCISIKRNRIGQTVYSRSSASVLKAASIIDANLHLSITIPSIAKKAELSQNYLARLFKKHYGMTLTHYQTKKRMELAKYLLLHSDAKIKEIGERCGLPDPQHFNKLFKKFVGKNPSAVRANQKWKNHEFKIL